MSDLTDEQITALCDAATTGPWFFTGYSSVQSAPKIVPHDRYWSAKRCADGHTYEHHAGEVCPACGPRHLVDGQQTWGCALAGEAMDMEPVVARVDASYGDTATGQRVRDAEFIAAARDLVPGLLARAQQAEAERDELRDKIAEMTTLYNIANNTARSKTPDFDARAMAVQVAQREAADRQWRAAEDRLAAVRDVIRQAQAIGPSPSMTVYVADLQRALGEDVPRPHKKGGGDA